MKKAYTKLPYRKNVACIVFQGRRFLLVQKPEWPNHCWKFPQGGINEKESEFEAAKREVIEEIGTDKFKIHGLSVHTNQYDWDNPSIKLANFRWRGQKQKFVLVEFLGSNKDLKIDYKEIKAHKWIDFDDLQLHVNHSHPSFTGYWKTLKNVIKEFEKLFQEK